MILWSRVYNVHTLYSYDNFHIKKQSEFNFGVNFQNQLELFIQNKSFLNQVLFELFLWNCYMYMHRDLSALVSVLGRFWLGSSAATGSAVKVETSPKGFLASKCDEGNWIFSKSWESFGNFLGILCGILLGIINDCLHFQKSTGFLHFQSQLIGHIVKIRWFFML